MRSASRYGRHDLGDNAARIAGFLTALDAAVAGAAGPAPGDQAPPPAPTCRSDGTAERLVAASE